MSRSICCLTGVSVSTLDSPLFLPALVAVRLRLPALGKGRISSGDTCTPLRLLADCTAGEQEVDDVDFPSQGEATRTLSAAAAADDVGGTVADEVDWSLSEDVSSDAEGTLGSLVEEVKGISCPAEDSEGTGWSSLEPNNVDADSALADVEGEVRSMFGAIVHAGDADGTVADGVE